MLLLWVIWFITERILWYFCVIKNNPKIVKMTPVLTTNENSNKQQEKKASKKIIAPHCTFKQYLRYLWLVTLPYVWSVPIKYCKLLYTRKYKKCCFSELQKRLRLAKMVLESSLILGFEEKNEKDMCTFAYRNFYLLSNKDVHQHIVQAVVLIHAPSKSHTVLREISIDGKPLVSINEMFAFLHCLLSIVTHPCIHAQAGNIAEINHYYSHRLKDVDSKDLLESISDMHATAAGLNEASNHYPADAYGVPRKDFQYIIGYNISFAEFKNHQRIVLLKDISKYAKFTIKSRVVFKKYLGKYNIDISTIMANIFHSLDHYNISKYFLYDSEEKSYNGVDVRTLHAFFVELNYDWGNFQSMRFAKQRIWKSIYNELKEIDEEYAENLHIFMSV